MVININKMVKTSGMRVGVLTVASLAFAACSDDNNEPVTMSEEVAEAVEEFRTVYADIAHAKYSDALDLAEALKVSIESFNADPSAVGLTAAREAYLAARKPYGQTECYRFSNGPIDDDDGPEGLLNAWPLDEAFLDAEEAGVDPLMGESLVEDEDFVITVANLEAVNEQGGDKNISSGYHAVEFLLFGKDTDPAGPGNRPYTDFLNANDPDGTSEFGRRRRTLLVTLTEGIIGNLQDMVDAWAPDEDDNFRAQFVTEEPQKSAGDVLTGLAIFGALETAGERLGTPLREQVQEEEHSCFSDDTNNDMLYSALCIQNVYEGRYTREGGDEVSGTGLRSVVMLADEDLADALGDQIDDAVSKANGLTARFDQAILDEDSDGYSALEALQGSFSAMENPLRDSSIAIGAGNPTVELPE